MIAKLTPFNSKLPQTPKFPTPPEEVIMPKKRNIDDRETHFLKSKDASSIISNVSRIILKDHFKKGISSKDLIDLGNGCLAIKNAYLKEDKIIPQDNIYIWKGGASNGK
jgi:hypothetical protein